MKKIMLKIKYIIPIALMIFITACDNRTDAEKRYDEARENFDRDLDRIIEKGKRDLDKNRRGVEMEYYQKCKENAYGTTICTTEYGYPD